MGFAGLLSMIFIVPETHFDRQSLKYNLLKNNFFSMITHQLFLGIVLLMGVTYSLLIVFNTLGPFLIQTSLHYSSIYFGKIALLLGATFLAGTFICRRLLKQFYPENILFYAISFFTIIAMLSTILAFIYNHNIWTIILPSFFMFLGCGVIYPTAMGRALFLFRHLAGSATAIMNLISLLITSTTSFVMSFIHSSNVIIIIYVYLALMILANLIYYLFIYNLNSVSEN